MAPFTACVFRLQAPCVRHKGNNREGEMLDAYTLPQAGSVGDEVNNNKGAEFRINPREQGCD